MGSAAVYYLSDFEVRTAGCDWKLLMTSGCPAKTTNVFCILAERSSVAVRVCVCCITLVSAEQDGGTRFSVFPFILFYITYSESELFSIESFLSLLTHCFARELHTVTHSRDYTEWIMVLQVFYFSLIP